MRSRILLVAIAVVGLVGATWLWTTTGTSPAEVPVASQNPPVTQPPTALPDDPKSLIEVKSAVPPQVTSGDLLSNEALTERDLLAGLSKIVLTPARKAEDRNEALSHLLNLTDEEHNDTLLALARDPALDGPLARRLFEDAFNRSLGWQVDLGLVLLERKDIAPLQPAVREHLLFLLGPEMPPNSDLNTLKQAGASAKKHWADQAAQ